MVLKKKSVLRLLTLVFLPALDRNLIIPGKERKSVLDVLPNTLGITESLPEVGTADKYFTSLHRKRPSFPGHSSIEELIATEWKNPDRKVSSGRRISKLHPVAAEDSSSWSSPPVVDAPVIRVVRRSSLPLDGPALLHDPMERRIEASLSRAYVAAGAICQPTVAMTSVSRALKCWILDLKDDIESGVPREQLLDSLSNIKLAAEFFIESSSDVLKLAARCMGLSVSARRALWLKHWHADNSSKNSLVSIPFDGKLLFGKVLDDAIRKAAEGEKVFLPQERRRLSRTVWNDRRNFRSSFRDSRQYRPGKEVARMSAWRGGFRGATKGSRSRQASSFHGKFQS
ncbi:lamina-associated polypeptide 2, isoforms alpha/zeta-like [Pelodytes ibericus]